jgi:hypothetical protein
MENNDNNELIRSSLLDNAKEFLTDIANIGLDELMEKIIKEENILKELPVIKWLFLAHNVGNIIQKAFFLKKYSNFIGPIIENMEDDIKNVENMKEIFTDEKVYQKIIEQSIIALDRYQTTQKAKMLGILFVKTFKNKKFSIEEYNTLVFSIDNIHPAIGIKCLKNFYDYKNEMDNEKDENKKREIWGKNSTLDFSALVNTVLLKLPNGSVRAGNFGGAFINDLGYRFYEFVATKV